ncbi:hypothetical protein [Ornithinimicrobium kibberense]
MTRPNAESSATADLPLRRPATSSAARKVTRKSSMPIPTGTMS